MGYSVVEVNSNIDGSKIKMAILSREDLNSLHYKLPNNKITIHHFKSEALNLEDINKCSVIIFKSEDYIKQLKNRFL